MYLSSLPNYVVDVQSIDVFKVHLDRFWAQQEVMFDWTADLTGTGDRSEYIYICLLNSTVASIIWDRGSNLTLTLILSPKPNE